MAELFGYDGTSSQRIVALAGGKRKVLAWGDEITEEEIAPFVAYPGFSDVWIEEIVDKAAEALTYPQYADNTPTGVENGVVH